MFIDLTIKIIKLFVYYYFIKMYLLFYHSVVYLLFCPTFPSRSKVHEDRDLTYLVPRARENARSIVDDRQGFV